MCPRPLIHQNSTFVFIHCSVSHHACSTNLKGGIKKFTASPLQRVVVSRIPIETTLHSSIHLSVVQPFAEHFVFVLLLLFFTKIQLNKYKYFVSIITHHLGVCEKSVLVCLRYSVQLPTLQQAWNLQLILRIWICTVIKNTVLSRLATVKDSNCYQPRHRAHSKGAWK